MMTLMNVGVYEVDLPSNYNQVCPRLISGLHKEPVVYGFRAFDVKKSCQKNNSNFPFMSVMFIWHITLQRAYSANFLISRMQF